MCTSHEHRQLAPGNPKAEASDTAEFPKIQGASSSSAGKEAAESLSPYCPASMTVGKEVCALTPSELQMAQHRPADRRTVQEIGDIIATE